MRYNQEAEECCLGAAMTNREVAKQFVADLEPMDFHVVGHQNIAAAIVAAILTRYVTEFEGFQRRFLELESKEAK